MKFLGCGTGRCGTHSLATLIDGCEEWACGHEARPLLPWDVDKILARDRIECFKGRDKVGEVAFFYLPYIKLFMDEFPDLKVISLKRDQDATVESYKRNTRGKNHWKDHDGNYWDYDPYDPCYPKYDIPLDVDKEKEKELAIREFWEEYYEYSAYLQDQYPDRFHLFAVDVLNDVEKQRQMFDFLGIKNPNVQVGIRENVTDDSS